MTVPTPENPPIPTARPDRPQSSIPSEYQMAGAADVYSYGNGMGAQSGMVTPQQAQIGEADRLQAIKLQQALKQMRSGRG